MNRRASCFAPGSVICRLDSTEKYAAIHELIEKAPVFKHLSDRGAFEKSVVAREKSQSTGYGKGVAFAHGRTDEVDTLFISLGISKQGIPFDSVDGEPVHLLFIIANNPSRKIEYLQALSTLAELVRDDAFRARLMQGSRTEELEKMLGSAFRSNRAKKTA